MTDTNAHIPLLLDTGPVCYPGPDGITWRPCRTWSTEDADGRVVLSIVTEIGAGKSVTNAAEFITAALHGTWSKHGANRIRVVEHYPTDDQPERYAEYQHSGGLFTGFRHITAADVAALLGPDGARELAFTAPTGPVVDGAWC